MNIDFTNQELEMVKQILLTTSNGHHLFYEQHGTEEALTLAQEYQRCYEKVHNTL